MKESIFLDQIRDIFAILDRGIYGLITIFYDTIEQLASTSIISNAALNDIAMKIYGLLALFMIFKISFSLINFIVNPDLIVDKAKGGAALIKNIIITFVLIITVPFAFDLLYRAQSAIISDGIIQKYILGGNMDEAGYSVQMSEHCTENATTDSVGNYIGLMTFKPFFQLSEDSLSEDREDFTTIELKYCRANTYSEMGNASVSNLLKGRDVYDAPHAISWDHYYVIDYTIFLSTIIGVVIALLFLSFCFDVAVRTIKLQFLELIAPIPIISYIDPDSSKNGMFKKWTKEVFTTWLSLFMRLAAIYFAIYIIGLLANMDLPGNSLWIKLLIIIGALIFAKQLPKMLEDIIGIKGSGKFTLNPLKKLDNEALGFKEGRILAGKAAVAAGSAGLSVVGSVVGRNRAKEKFNTDKNKIYDDVRQKIEDSKSKDLKNSKNNLDYMEANARYKARMDALNKGNIAALDKQNAEKLNKLNEDYNKFSNNHPIAAGIASAGRSAASGFTKGAKSFSDALQNATAAATQAAKVKIAHDNLSLSDRMQDYLTDIGGVKNDSGTTSAVKKQIKEVTEGLTDITNNISSLNYALGDIQRTAPGSIAYDSNGQMQVNNSYAWTDPNQKAQLQYTIDSYNELRGLQKTRQKELNTLNDILSKPNSGK